MYRFLHFSNMKKDFHNSDSKGVDLLVLSALCALEGEHGDQILKIFTEWFVNYGQRNK